MHSRLQGLSMAICAAAGILFALDVAVSDAPAYLGIGVQGAPISFREVVGKALLALALLGAAVWLGRKPRRPNKQSTHV